MTASSSGVGCRAPNTGLNTSACTLGMNSAMPAINHPTGNTQNGMSNTSHSGNQTTAIRELVVCDGFDSGTPCQVNSPLGTVQFPGGVAGPDDNADGDPAPETGIIVKFDGSGWIGPGGNDWGPFVNFSLPDFDDFAVAANTLNVGYTFSKYEGARWNQFSLGNVYAFSKRTQVYVQGTYQRASGDAQSAAINGVGVAAQRNQLVVSTGVHHSF